MGQKAKNAGKKTNKTKQQTQEDQEFQDYMKSIPTMIRIPTYSQSIEGFKTQHKGNLLKTCQNTNCRKKYYKDTKKTFKVCGGCNCAYYCCKECQREDWVNHKKKCGFIGIEPNNKTIPNNQDFLVAVNIHMNMRKDSEINNSGRYWVCSEKDEDCYYLRTITKEEFENKYLIYIKDTDKAIIFYEEQIKTRSIFVSHLDKEFMIA